MTNTLPFFTPWTRACTALLTCTVLLCACGSGDATGAAPSANEVASLKAKIQALEKSGTLPALDRSASIAGPDANNNGVRDDIEAYIATLPITPVQKTAAVQYAKTFQQALTVDLSDTAALDNIGVSTARAIHCAADVFMPNYQDGFDLGTKLEAMTANTKERAKQYLAYNRAVSGSTGSLPSGNTCDP